MRRFFFLVSISAVVGCALFACSADDDGSSGGPSKGGSGGAAGTGGAAGGAGGSGGVAGQAGSGASDVGGSGGSSGGSGGGSGGGDAGGSGGGTGGSGTYQGGYVSLMQSVMTISGTEYASYSFSAAFSRGTYDPGASTCDFRDEGPCRITDCTTEPADGGTPAYESASAGAISLAGANKPLTLVPTGSGSYEVLSGQEKLWSGGATLSISAAGDEVPAFDANLYGAVPALLTLPVLPPAGTPVTLSTKTPLSIAWTGAGGGKMMAMLTRSVTSGTTRTVMVSCTFEASTGSGTVPASAMGAIPPGPDGTFQVLGGDLKAIDVSGWTVNVQEYVPAVSASGTVASVMATYQ